jgi:hypothetical protein
MKQLLSLLLSAACLLGYGRDIHIGTTYGLTDFQGKVAAKSLYPTMDALRAKCPDAVKHWKDLGVADAVILEQSLATVYGLDATWKGAINPTFTGTPVTNNNVAWPAGTYWFTDGLRTSYGKNTGGGDFVFYPGNSSTEFRMWEEKWLGSEEVTDLGIKYRCLVMTPTWGNTTLQGYAEGWTIEGIRLVGPYKPYAETGIYRVGLGLWDAGEMFRAYVRSDGFDVGVCTVYGTPYLSMMTTVFNNTVAGWLSVGGSLNGGAVANLSQGSDTLKVYLSGDDNGRLFMGRDGFSRPGGGNWTIIYTKAETGVTDLTLRPNGDTGQPIIDFEGLFGITVINMVAASASIQSHAMYVLNAKHYASKLVVINSRQFGYSYSVMDVGNDKLYPVASDQQNHRLEWASKNGGSLTIEGVPQVAAPCPCNSRLGRLKKVNGVIQGQFDNQQCTPSWSAYGPTTDPAPSACTWVLGTQSCTGCVNGQMTCTTPYVSSVTGCTPTVAKPTNVVTTTACTVSSLKYSKSFTSSTSDGTLIVAPTKVNPSSYMKLVNVKFTAVTQFTWVNSNLFIGQDGYLWTLSPFLTTGIKPVVGEAINKTVNMNGTNLPHVVGAVDPITGVQRKTSRFTGTIEYY